MISKIVIALHVVLTLVVLAVTVRTLQDEANEKKGVVQVLVRNSSRRQRGTNGSEAT